MPGVAKVRIAGRAEYEHPITETLLGYIQGDFNYRGSFQSQFRSPLAGVNYNYHVPSYLLGNLAVGARFSGYDVSVFVDNVGNKVAYITMSGFLDSTRIYTARPRTVGVHASARF